MLWNAWLVLGFELSAVCEHDTLAAVGIVGALYLVRATA